MKQKSNWLFLFTFLLALAGLSAAQSVHQLNSGYTPQRVYDAKGKRFSDFETMLAVLVRADVIFVGEQHDDPATHRLERALLEGVARRRPNVVVALEMFERDVQQALNDYLAGKLSEEEFLKAARPWPRYATDYKPVIEFARAHNWRVIAGNVPRRYASQVAKTGLNALDALPAAERQLIAAQIACPPDAYYQRFVEAMNDHPGADGKNEKKSDEELRKQKELTERMYQAQCVKDETMAESIAKVFAEPASAKPLVIHYNGAFHSDYHLGAAALTKQRLPQADIKVVSVIPLADLDTIKTDEYRKRGDYLIFALKPAKPPAKPKEASNK